MSCTGRRALICEYLDAEHGHSRLFPNDSTQRWSAMRGLPLGDGMLETCVLALRACRMNRSERG